MIAGNKILPVSSTLKMPTNVTYTDAAASNESQNLDQFSKAKSQGTTFREALIPEITA